MSKKVSPEPEPEPETVPRRITSIALSDYETRLADALADYHGTSRSAVIRMAIRKDARRSGVQVPERKVGS